MLSAKVNQYLYLGLEGTNTRKPPAETDEHAVRNKVSNPVIYIYQTKVADLCRIVIATWIINHSLCITVENISEDRNPCTCKIDLKPWQFWGKKGLKSLETDGNRVNVYWDFLEAKFSDSPQPCSDYYVALVSDKEVILLLGDIKIDAYRRTRARPSFIEPTLLCKKKNVSGKKVFCTSAKLLDEKKEHDIVIERLIPGPGDPEILINIDRLSVIQVMNLNWKFRGNETILFKNKSIHIFWNVHDWLFNNTSGTSCGFFVFKPGIVDCNLDDNGEEGTPCTEYCHFLYAWRID